MNLYIIGNGFDLSHGLRTSYQDYRQFLHMHYPEVANCFEHCEYLNTLSSDRWSDLEMSLRISYEECMQDAFDNFYPDMTSDRPEWEDMGIEIRNKLGFLQAFTGSCLWEWIGSVNVYEIASPRHEIDPDGYFVSFNYTNTLEEVYGIPRERVFHIHGNVSVGNLQFGSTDNDAGKTKSGLERRYGEDDFYGASISEPVDLLTGYCGVASKNLPNNYEYLRHFLDSLPAKPGILNIIVMGHSYCGIDYPYYKDILHPWSCQWNAKWCFFCHDDRDKLSVNEFSRMLGIKNAEIKNW